MIRIGYIDRPRPRRSDLADDRPDRSGRLFHYNPMQGPPAGSAADPDAAQTTIHRVRAFLRRMAAWEATHLFRPSLSGTVRTQWINAEAEGVDLADVSVAGEPRRIELTCADLPAVARHRRGPHGRGYDVSWVYYRLWWLSEQDRTQPPVEIWELNIAEGALMLARSTRRRPSGDPLILVDGWSQDGSRNVRMARSDEEFGEAIVHELVIHYYRDRRALGRSMPALSFVYGTSGLDSPTGGHLSYPYHGLVQHPAMTRRCRERRQRHCPYNAHTLPDVEADLLIMYLRNRGMRYLDPRIGPQQQALHDRYVSDLREALVARSSGQRRPADSRINPQAYHHLQMYTPNLAGTTMRLPGPQ